MVDTRRVVVLTGLLVAGAQSIAVARSQQDPAALHIQKVKDNLHVITGGRGTGQQADTISGR